jgi:TolB protein
MLSLSGANFRPMPLAIARPVSPPDQDKARLAAETIDAALQQDLGVSGLFELLDRRSFLADPSEGSSAADIKFDRWLDVGAETLVKVRVTSSGNDAISAEFGLFNVVLGKQELSKRYSVSNTSEARALAHRFADDLVTFYTREPGAFQTQLAFVRKVKGTKQIFVGDWDAQNARQLTSKSLNLLPSWLSNGQEITFTGYQSGAPALYRMHTDGTGQELVFRRYSTLVTGACFSPDGKRVAFAMSQEDGNSHLWIADANGENARQLTSGFGINSSPSFSPDGQRIAYVSNRAGNPQIYVIAAAGGTPKRLTFQGNYNQTPEWSPRGDLIVFTARDERAAFDIFTVEVETGKITRLTQDSGNNEEPTWSPNGRLIAFTSTRTGKSQLYVMSADGAAQRQMTKGKDEVFTPSWGPFQSNAGQGSVNSVAETPALAK